MFTTAGPTAAAALANESLPRHPRPHLESSEFPLEPWLLALMGASDAETKEFSIGNPPAYTNFNTVSLSGKQAL
jgi:hypothetical protein